MKETTVRPLSAQGSVRFYMAMPAYADRFAIHLKIKFLGIIF